ncbi:hypothetical protein LshimejAT787_0404740 [Lyophyllum shimeji]|uniref:F-box domain-containing protein n=1 Tax=Lyophyllum shimeji TaxID=47721 RepID=A0A9P3PK65_LYOSH|nr:hypothetical protein LshimejAT787_0404740 [Lyophyllum shimeji]
MVMMSEAAATPSLATYPGLPPEILFLIFLRAIPPNFLLDTSLAAGPNSPWCKALAFKRSLILVCKEWYAVGVRLLYEDVVFRRMNQMTALLRTLETSGGKFCDLIKRVTLYAYIPDTYSPFWVRCIQRLMDLCPRISRFDAACPWAFPYPLPPSLPRLTSSITHLQLHAALTAAEQFSVLDNQNLPKRCHLPNLGTLIIGMFPVGNDRLSSIGGIFSMPRLRQLTCEFDYFGPDGVTTIDMEHYIPFLEIHGRQLRSLHVRPAFLWTMKGFRISSQRMVDACPVLEHLVLHPCADPVTHKNVKWVDVWSRHVAAGPESSWRALRESLTTKFFPKLERVRVLSSSLSLFCDIPTVFPPDIVSEPKDVLEFEFPGVYLRHDLGFVWSERQIDVDTMYDEDDSGDEDYCSDSSSSSSPSDDDGASVSSAEYSYGLDAYEWD